MWKQLLVLRGWGGYIKRGLNLYDSQIFCLDFFYLFNTINGSSTLWRVFVYILVCSLAVFVLLAGMGALQHFLACYCHHLSTTQVFLVQVHETQTRYCSIVYNIGSHYECSNTQYLLSF